MLGKSNFLHSGEDSSLVYESVSLYMMVMWEERHYNVVQSREQGEEDMVELAQCQFIRTEHYCHPVVRSRKCTA